MDVPTELTREMGCSVAEFERWLPGATHHAPIERTGMMHRVLLKEGNVEIILEERPSRRIALLVIPVLGVTFRFHGLEASQRAAFMQYFDHYTRRGGG